MQIYIKSDHFSSDENKICQKEIEKNPYKYNFKTEYNFGEKNLQSL
jgi:hypothetical protein